MKGRCEIEIERTKCEKCGSTNLKHYETRSVGEHGEGYVTEYRECKKCKHVECLGCSFA